MIRYSQKFKKGFTLVELLIAIAILSISILAVFTAVSNNIHGQNFSEDQVTAYYLADEGIEYIRNIRDQNGISNIYAIGSGGSTVSWLNGISSLCSTACTVDSPHPSPAVGIVACSGGPATCAPMKRDSTTGLYGYASGWTVTPFTRSVTVTSLSATEATITSTVSWTTSGVSKSYSVSEIIRDWQ